MPVAMTIGTESYYLTYDQVGSLRIVVDALGNVVKRIDYDSFGSIINDKNPGFAIPFGFAGGLHDRDTNLVRFGFRDYDPDVGRWTAKDPIGFRGGDVDLYKYASHNPINWIDPLGLKGTGGILIPIRNWIKRSLKGGEFILDLIGEVGDIPTSPSAILMYDFLNPREGNIGEEGFMEYWRMRQRLEEINYKFDPDEYLKTQKWILEEMLNRSQEPQIRAPCK